MDKLLMPVPEKTSGSRFGKDSQSKVFTVQHNNIKFGKKFRDPARKVVIICGPTATGKTSLGVFLAKKFCGEIISADSRQVYIGMDIITGKDLPVSSKFKIQNSKLQVRDHNFQVGYRIKDGIPIWLVDIVEPSYRFNVGEFQKLAKIVIKDIISRGKLPIVVGGTGLYIKSLVEPLAKVNIPANDVLRQKLDKLSVRDLQKKLRQINKNKWDSMNNSDKNNPRRLIRAIEIEVFNKKQKDEDKKKKNEEEIFNKLVIGLKVSKKKFPKLIEKRVNERMRQGAVLEIEKLLEKGFDFSLASFSALGYKYFRQYFEKTSQLTKEEKNILLQKIIEEWKVSEVAYAKRQLTWFQKSLKEQKGIWFDSEEKDLKGKIEKIVNKWYTQNKKLKIQS